MPPHRVGKILENYLRREGLQQRIQEQRILDAWEVTVGKAIAEMTDPVRVRNRILQVKVTNSVWMHELQFHKKLIVQKLNKYTGNPIVQDLWFFMGEKEAKKKVVPERGKENREKPDRELSREEKDRIEREISHLIDPEMREILLRVFSKGLTWKKGRITKKVRERGDR